MRCASSRRWARGGRQREGKAGTPSCCRPCGEKGWGRAPPAIFGRRGTTGQVGLCWARACWAAGGLLRPGKLGKSFSLFFFSVFNFLFCLSFQFESDLNSFFICRFLIVLNLIKL
jgi:hypothetical protein